MVIDPRELFNLKPKAEEAIPSSFSGTRAERMQRLQVGGFGLAAMVLMVALADIVISRARETDAASVAETAPAAAADTAAPRDPLADAGVLPDLPASAAATGPAAPQEGRDAPPPVR
jgi:hypothetical protein